MRHRVMPAGRQGFSPLILVIALGIVLVLGGGGFWFYQQSVKQNEPAPQTQASTDSFSAPAGQSKEQSKTRDDFGCWPPSCSSIPDAQGKKSCEDWKAGKAIQWPAECSALSQSGCAKLCEFEKKNNPQQSVQQSHVPSSGQSPSSNYPNFNPSQGSGAPGGISSQTVGQGQSFDTLPSLVQAEFASGVSEEDKNLAIQGIAAMDFYLKKWFGKSTDKPSGLQVSAAGSDPNGGAQVKTESGTAIILLETGNFGWQRQIQSNKEVGGEWRPRLVAHEYVHVYQFQNGCGRVDVENPIASKWFIEGEADWLSYKATIDAGQLPPLSISELVMRGAKPVVGSLKSFEKSSNVVFSAYPLFNMAIDYLMKDRSIKALDNFCANIGSGMDSPKAFETAFGITLDKFYEGFEAYRKTW